MDKPHRKLVVWQNAVELSVLTYQFTQAFPQPEQYALSIQMRRAAVSVPSNLAEGAARKGKKEFLQFLNIARASLSELDTQVEIAYRVGYLDQTRKDRFDENMSEVDRLLFGFLKSVEAKRS